MLHQNLFPPVRVINHGQELVGYSKFFFFTCKLPVLRSPFLTSWNFFTQSCEETSAQEYLVFSILCQLNYKKKLVCVSVIKVYRKQVCTVNSRNQQPLNNQVFFHSKCQNDSQCKRFLGNQLWNVGFTKGYTDQVTLTYIGSAGQRLVIANNENL